MSRLLAAKRSIPLEANTAILCSLAAVSLLA